MVDLSKVCDVEIDGIDFNDVHDWCDAFVSNASIIDGENVRQATDEELDYINDDSSFVYEQVIKVIY